MRLVICQLSLVIGSWIIAAPALAQVPDKAPQDALERTKRLNEIQARKVEADVRLAISEAGRLAATNQSEAIEKLKVALAQLETDQTLATDRKASLIRVVKDRIRVTEAGPNDADIVAAKKAQEARDAARLEQEKRQKEEKEKIRTSLESIAKLRKEGKSAEVKKLLDELTKNYPDNLAVLVATGADTIRNNLKEAAALQKDKEQRTVAAIRNIDEASIPASNDVEFPKDWRERTEKRKPKATPAEKELIRQLETPIDATFKDSRLEDVLQYFSTSMGRTIVPQNLDESQITYDTKVTFAAKGKITTRAALRAILSNLNLTYVVRDDILYVTTPQRAKDMMTTKVYYVGDLVVGLSPFGGAPTVGAQLDLIQLGQNVNMVIDMLTSSIDPASWELKHMGGGGTIGFNLPTMSLIIRQSQEVHAMFVDRFYNKR